ncbi:MAG TPA: hypothetical protein VHZ99_06425 [Steroidobacteraceae bacterium]|jgi:hypothetical protein|nr:hypothetical protein [Steroidobacteraceae bacterium]
MRAQPLNARAIASAERHALWQRVSLYSAAQRREVIRRTVAGSQDAALVANDLQMPVRDVRAIAEAFASVPRRLS